MVKHYLYHKRFILIEMIELKQLQSRNLVKGKILHMIFTLLPLFKMINYFSYNVEAALTDKYMHASYFKLYLDG